MKTIPLFLINVVINDTNGSINNVGINIKANCTYNDFDETLYEIPRVLYIAKSLWYTLTDLENIKFTGNSMMS